MKRTADLLVRWVLTKNRGRSENNKAGCGKTYSDNRVHVTTVPDFEAVIRLDSGRFPVVLNQAAPFLCEDK